MLAGDDEEQCKWNNDQPICFWYEKCVRSVEEVDMIFPSFNFVRTHIFDRFFGLLSTKVDSYYITLLINICKYIYINTYIKICTHVFKKEDEGNG